MAAKKGKPVPEEKEQPKKKGDKKADKKPFKISKGLKKSNDFGK